LAFTRRFLVFGWSVPEWKFEKSRSRLIIPCAGLPRFFLERVSTMHSFELRKMKRALDGDDPGSWKQNPSTRLAWLRRPAEPEARSPLKRRVPFAETICMNLRPRL